MTMSMEAQRLRCTTATGSPQAGCPYAGDSTALSLKTNDVEDMLAERVIDVSDETVRRRALKFGTVIARKLRGARCGPQWGHLDEVFVFRWDFCAG